MNRDLYIYLAFVIGLAVGYVLGLWAAPEPDTIYQYIPVDPNSAIYNGTMNT